MVMTVVLGCIVGVSVVAQTLYTSTIEHLKEFATVKAIGGRNSDIYAIIAKQAAIAAVAGFALGAAISYGLRPVMVSLDLRLLLTPRLAISVFVGTLALCVGAAAISCRKVATLDPAMVFRG
jgi:putative ABC transport system permease protein